MKTSLRLTPTERGTCHSAEIIETRRMAGNWQEYTGSYRLVGVPGGYIELPGRGGPATRLGALRALAAFAAGETNATAQLVAQHA